MAKKIESGRLYGRPMGHIGAQFSSFLQRSCVRFSQSVSASSEDLPYRAEAPKLPTTSPTIIGHALLSQYGDEIALRAALWRTLCWIKMMIFGED